MNRRAFTLMEVLVAAAIFATVVTLASSLLIKSFVYYGESSTLTENMLRMKTFSQRLNDELSSVMSVSGDENATVFAGNDTALSCVIVTTSGVAERRYAFDGTARTITRAVGSYDGNLSTPGAAEAVLGNVRAATFLYYNGTAWRNETSVIPRAVKITAQMARGSFNETIAETIYIPAGS